MEKLLSKISVIVPVYKVEKYLPACIESVLAQTFPDFELLLVDDGSPDNSGAICDEYAARDSRVRVFHKPNGGVTSARRLGVERSRAEWIFLLDGDDWLDPQCLEKMRERAEETDADYVVGDFYIDDDCGNTIRERIFDDFGVATQKEFLDYCFSHSDFYITGRLFRKRALDGVFEKIPPHITFGEDNVMQCLMIFNLKRFAKLNFKVLHYVQRSGSVCNSMRAADLRTRAEAVDFVADLVRERCVLSGKFREVFFGWLAQEAGRLALSGAFLRSEKILLREMQERPFPTKLNRKQRLSLFLLRRGCRIGLCALNLLVRAKQALRERGRRGESVALLHEGSIGDTIVMMPLLPHIRKAFPGKRILLVNLARAPIAESILRGTKQIDEFFTFPGTRGKISAVLNLWKFLRKNRATGLVWLLRSFGNAPSISREMRRHKLFFRFCGISRFFGMEDRDKIPAGQVLSMLAEALRRSRIPVPPDAELAWDYRLSEEETRQANRVSEKLGISPETTLAIGVGGKQRSCQWSEDSWAEALNRIVGELGFRLCFLGSAAEAGKIERLRERLPAETTVSLAAESLSLRELSAVLKNCMGYLGQDTGVLHIAASVGIPCVGIFSARNPEKEWYPWKQDAGVLRASNMKCSGCGLAKCRYGDPASCMNEISANQVFDFVKNTFAAKRKGFNKDA